MIIIINKRKKLQLKKKHCRWHPDQVHKTTKITKGDIIHHNIVQVLLSIIAFTTLDSTKLSQLCEHHTLASKQCVMMFSWQIRLEERNDWWNAATGRMYHALCVNVNQKHSGKMKCHCWIGLLPQLLCQWLAVVKHQLPISKQHSSVSTPCTLSLSLTQRADIPSLRSLLVVAEKIRSSECFQHWLGDRKGIQWIPVTKALHTALWNCILSLHSTPQCTFSLRN